MTALEFARKYIRFNEVSPISGVFRDEFYPFLRKPLAATDDIRCKRLVVLKASSSMGSVFGEIVNTKRVLCDAGHQIMICQTDDKANEWSKKRGKKWLSAIPDIERLISTDAYAITNTLWTFRHKWLGISGPGINKAQSDQVRFLQTDEAHLDAYLPGALTEWEKRLGGGWSAQATHISTAADKGKEIDNFYYEGDQNECHWRCVKCSKLFWPLTGKDSRDYYNGELVLHLDGDVPFAICPHCQTGYQDNHSDRYDLVRDSDYVAMNPTAPTETQSFRWAVWFAHWIAWRGLAQEHKQAIASAKLGDLKPFEDWEKKRLCKSYVPTLPDFGDGKGKSDYKLGDIWAVSESLRVLTGDPQAGLADEGAHIHALVTEWDREGKSRRQHYRRVPNFPQFESVQRDCNVKPWHVMVDAGHDLRTVLRECGARGYNAFRGSDEPGIDHSPSDQNGMVELRGMPYSQAAAESGIVGSHDSTKKQKRLSKLVLRGKLPPGWAWVITGANPMLDGFVYALITGTSERYFGIASDMDQCYVENMPAFIPIIENDKKTGQLKKMVWKLVRKSHWHDLEKMAVVVAARFGFFPLAKTQTQNDNDRIT